MGFGVWAFSWSYSCLKLAEAPSPCFASRTLEIGKSVATASRSLTITQALEGLGFRVLECLLGGSWVVIYKWSYMEDNDGSL